MTVEFNYCSHMLLCWSFRNKNRLLRIAFLLNSYILLNLINCAIGFDISLPFHPVLSYNSCVSCKATLCPACSDNGVLWATGEAFRAALGSRIFSILEEIITGTECSLRNYASSTSIIAYLLLSSLSPGEMCTVLPALRSWNRRSSCS